MNVVRFAALCLCCWLAGLALVSAQQPEKTSRTLVVESSATIYARPDVARLSFFVVTEAAIKGREENDKQVKKMQERLTALGLANVDVQVVPFALSKVPVNDVVPNGVPQPQLDHVQTKFTVVVREKNLDKLRGAITKVADVATENGGRATGKIEEAADPLVNRAFKFKVKADAIAGPKIEWLRENTSDFQRDAVKRAVDEALANAQAAVGNAKLTVVKIDVSQVHQRDESYTSALISRLNPDPQASNSEVPVTMRVTVTYSY